MLNDKIKLRLDTAACAYHFLSSLVFVGIDTVYNAGGGGGGVSRIFRGLRITASLYLLYGGMMKEWAERFYNSDQWKECRGNFLESKDNLCERCSTPDDPVLAKIAHHKIYLTPFNINDSKISLCFDNLEALCQDCHNKEHHQKKRKKRYNFDSEGNIIPLPPLEK